MNKINDDPLLSIFENYEDIYYGKIKYVENIPNFFKYIISSNIDDDTKILVLENFQKIIQKNRYICEYFSSYENK